MLHGLCRMRNPAFMRTLRMSASSSPVGHSPPHPDRLRCDPAVPAHLENYRLRGLLGSRLGGRARTTTGLGP